jgi:long-chain acyl-CoA synthetase
MQRFEPESALAEMAATATTVMFGVPTMCIALCEAARGPAALPPLRIAHIGSADSAASLAASKRRSHRHPEVTASEMSGLATTFATAPAKRGGRKPSTHRDPSQPRRAGGEVQSSPSVARGWNDPEATAAGLAPGLAVGQRPRLRTRRNLFLVDRRRDDHPRRLQRLSREVASAVEHPAVLEAAVVGVPHRTLGEEVAAIVVPRPHAELDPDEVKALAKERVAAYKYPRYVVLVDELPKTSTGKIHKREIDLGPILEAQPSA